MASTNISPFNEFKNEVGLKFQLYNSLFTALPFHSIEKTGILLSLFLNNCEEGYQANKNPLTIIEEFFAKHTTYETEQEQIDLLFRFIQYAERQVVLFDALEDAAFTKVNDMNGVGTLKHLKASITQQTNAEEIIADNFCVRLVLTAHPTQFYPGSVLGIINDLSKALQENKTSLVNTYLQQLGKTPFLKEEKPTPYDEATSLIWYLENVFYTAAGKIASYVAQQLPAIQGSSPIFQMGFWPGGDRDGNPFVKADTTLKVAKALKGSIIKCYYLEVRRLKRRLTFRGVEKPLAELEAKLYQFLFLNKEDDESLNLQDIKQALANIRTTLKEKHNGLFIHLLDQLIYKLSIFGFHFASLDIRQDSSVHDEFYKTIFEDSTAQQHSQRDLSFYSSLKKINPPTLDNEVLNDVLSSIETINQIQQQNGEAGCHRYIISQCKSAEHVMQVYGLFLLNGINPEEIHLDIVPLFETIDDLKNAPQVMEQLYNCNAYKEHLKRRGDKQTIMLGFSDGTKDGGYLMANYSILDAKAQLTALAKKYHLQVVFFDGRGGPPARGGGKTHRFYASLGNDVANNEIHLTIQGQTVSSNFGTVEAAQYNIEQLLNAGIQSQFKKEKQPTLSNDQKKLFQELSAIGLNAYLALKNHPKFTDYLVYASPLKYYASTNIGSRPAKRGNSTQFTLKDLRAIPFVGAWSQMKQNLTGYYGVGFALEKMMNDGRWEEVQKLYQQNLFFRTLMDNCEMAMLKCFFPLTQHLKDDKSFGELWNTIFDEYQRAKKYVLLLSGSDELLGNYPVERISIQMRERIVTPLTTIQQYALFKIRAMEHSSADQQFKSAYEKLVMRCSFGIINAGRNSA